MLNQTSLKQGFTIIEMVMVITIVGVLSVVAIPQFIDFRDDAKKVITQKKLAELKEAIKGDPSLKANGQFTKIGFELNMGRLPTELSELYMLDAGTPGGINDPFSKRGWRGPYILSTSSTDIEWRKDGWGNEFDYNTTTKTITSKGADGTLNTNDDIIINL
ncbi:MAG: prepilin-type N-terminal cleavage/methylation domain-containing protein [Oligoflexia bacterium]|nr:prepilin-type N-terminal cleavage/methylation domain-containing protein [Oligoflexia bacterium]